MDNCTRVLESALGCVEEGESTLGWLVVHEDLWIAQVTCECSRIH